MNNFGMDDLRVQQARQHVISAHIQLSQASRQYSESIMQFLNVMNEQNNGDVYKMLSAFPLPVFNPPQTSDPYGMSHNTNGSINVPYGGHQQPQHHLTSHQSFANDKSTPFFSTVTPHQPLKHPGATPVPQPTIGTPTLGKRKASEDIVMDEEEDKKKKKKVKDPNAPKRPASAYILYQNHIRASLKDNPENAELSHKDMTKKIGEKWTALTTEERQPFIDSAKKAMEVWNRDKQQYRAEHPDGPDPNSVVPPKKRGRKSNAERAAMAAAAKAEEDARATVDAKLAQTGQPLGTGSIAPAATLNSSAAAAGSDLDSDESSSDSDDSDDEPAVPAKAVKQTRPADSDSDSSDESSSDEDDPPVVQKPLKAAKHAHHSVQSPAIAPSLTQKQPTHISAQQMHLTPQPSVVQSQEREKKKSKKKKAKE